jgi:hypothetical protein
MQRRNFLAASGALATLLAIPGTAAAASPAELRSDIDILRRARALHPGFTATTAREHSMTAFRNWT